MFCLTISSVNAKKKRTSNTSILKNLIFLIDDPFFSGLLLNSIMTSFKPTFISTRAMQFVNIISNSTTEGITKGHLFRTLGICLNQCPPSSDQRISVLNGAWKTISTLTLVSEYISCVEPWSQYTSMHFGVSSCFSFTNFRGNVNELF